MRALITNHRYHPFRGGSEIYVQKVGEWLVGEGWDVNVVTTDASDLEYFWDRHARPVAAPRNELIEGVRVTRVPVQHRRGGHLIFGGVRRLMGEASRFPLPPWPFEQASRFTPNLPAFEEALMAAGAPDVVIATNLGIESLAIRARAFARRMGVPFVLIPFAHLGDGTATIARRYVSMPHHRDLLAGADLTLTMTKLEAEFAADCGADARRIAVVGAGVTLDEVTGGDTRTFELLFGKERFIVAALGALAPDKGTCDLVEASALLVDPGLPVEFVLVGPELRSFTTWIERRGAHRWPWIHRPGMIDDNARRNLLAAIDVLALPSRTESFGIVFLEAWANAKPVVAAGVGAVNQIVEDGVDGLLVPFGDPQALANALSRLARCPALRTRMGVAGRRKVEAHYTWDRVLIKIGDAFERVLGLRVGAESKEAGG